jgi:PhnB protein
VEVRPILYFDGRCEEAIEFYRCALGAEVMMLMRFKDRPGLDAPIGEANGIENRVLHATFMIGDLTVQASDGDCMGQSKFQGFSLSITVAERAEAERIFAALADGGQIRMPMIETFFSPRYGIVDDRFGVSWKVHVVT